MDSRTVVAWVQVVGGAISMWSGHANRHRLRKAGMAVIAPGAAIMALGLAILTSGWVRYVAWAVGAIGGARILQQMFTARDRSALWLNIIFLALAMPIVVMELTFDDLSGWQRALFTGVGAVFAALLVMTIVKLVRSSSRVALPSA